MGNKKITEDEKIERTIRALLKLPENKRCINCNLLGPQYVCTTFLTFVCTTCSGIQEFTHRVKSVSMAKFSEEEVAALQAAGNERAREIYLKAWDPQRHSLPDGSNLHRLRDFIKHVYVDRKYTGERSERLPNVRVGHRVDSCESRKVIVFSGGSKSAVNEDICEWSPKERSSPSGRFDAVRGYYNERRSPQNMQEDSRYGGGGFCRSPHRIEIVDNRLKHDGSPSARRQDNRSFSPRQLVTRSPLSDHQKNMDRSTSPVVRPVRDILGENAPTLQLGEHSQAIAARDSDASSINKNIASSGGMECLIDFSMDSEPSNAVAAPNMQQVPPSSDGDNQSSDELSSKEKAPPASNAQTLEFLLFDLSVPSLDNVSAVPATKCAPSTAFGHNISVDSVSSAAPAQEILALTSIDGSSTVPSVVNLTQKLSNIGPLQTTAGFNGDYRVRAPEGHAFPSMQKHQSSLFSTSDNSSTAQESSTTEEALNSQPGTSSLMHNAQQSSNIPTERSSQATSKSTEETSFEVGALPLQPERKSVGRQELPEDLFTMSYASAPASAIAGWQNGPPHGIGFCLQYNPNAMHAAAFPGTAKANPFDLNNATTPAQAPSFPSVACIQPPTGVSPTSRFEFHSAGMASHSSYLASQMTPKSPVRSAMPSGANMGDQSHIGMPPSRTQGIGGFGSAEFISASSLSTTQRAPNCFPTMGANPFG